MHAMMTRMAIAIALMVAGSLQPVRGDTHYVSTTGANTWPYITPATAARSVQAGIDASADGDTVQVADGTYLLTNQVDIVKRIAVRSENGPARTVLHAARGPSQAWRCLLVDGSGISVSGFTIRNGRARTGFGKSPQNGDGGGIYCEGTNAIRNCIIVTNIAERFGGGIFLSYGSSMRSCTVVSNVAYQGGGMSALFCDDIQFCTFSNNSGHIGGGFDAHDSHIKNCLISRNMVSGWGGGAHIEQSASIENSMINRNNAQAAIGISLGGGIYGRQSGAIVRCIVRDNYVVSASGGSVGGGVALFDGGSIIANSRVFSNYASKDGGGIWLSALAMARNCVVDRNGVGSGRGGGIYAVDSSIQNCTIVSNAATAGGGGVFASNGVYVYNNIVTGNRLSMSGGGVDILSPNTTWSNSCSPWLFGNGNISSDPKFINADGCSYMLANDSPCINQGTFRLWMGLVRDFRGCKRVMNGAADMGAIEFGGALNDYNFNGKSEMATTLATATSLDWYSLGAGGTITLWGRHLTGPTSAQACQAVPGDYTGEGRSDLAAFVPSLGKWYVYSLGAGGTWILDGADWGYSGCVAVPGDYNGDGVADLAVFDPITGCWYVRTVTGGILGWAVTWRTGNCVPVAGDYDGDGRSDLAVYEPATTKWYIRTLSGTTIIDGWTWGAAGCTPVPGDYNGDGISDLIYYRLDGTVGKWSAKSLRREVLARDLAWGFSGCTPLMADFNGGGLMDLAVYHQATSLWYIFQPATGQVIANGTEWGGASMPAVKP